MLNTNTPIQEFIGGNWLGIAIFLLILKGIARQFGVSALNKIYLILQNAYSFVRPGTSADTLKEPDPKVKPPG